MRAQSSGINAEYFIYHDNFLVYGRCIHRSYMLTLVKGTLRGKLSNNGTRSSGNNRVSIAKSKARRVAINSLTRQDSSPLAGPITHIVIRRTHWLVHTAEEKSWMEGKQGNAMLQQQKGPADSFGRNSNNNGFSYPRSWTCSVGWAITDCWSI